MMQDLKNPAQIFRIIREHYNYAIFLNLQFKQHLRQQLTQDPAIQNSLFNFEQANPSIPNAHNLQREFLQRYEDIFFYQLFGKHATRPSIQQRQPLRNSGHYTTNAVRQSSKEEGHANSIYRSSQAIASQLVELSEQKNQFG
ncbi:hypothetical protein PPERSA_10091 [Pseudocohnilembus persalinus]|uniref:Uncharacterized protein n=1 Tax=Pseudocohnilembus persalinus TaxID=266149 RepID=A0A0V0QK43_PSEPJ|nr:hypothetical protein PPERSA_10091 [Pseudocohnilembus persalinus]|eukprot:KRX02474.1 hypothetical protein PPERSA_10091 [Pseudocohnilembus persalinus]